MLTREEVRGRLTAKGWRIKSDARQADGTRRMLIWADFPYEASSNKAAQHRCFKDVRKTVIEAEPEVGFAEWVNEDGGDVNTLQIELYVTVA